MPEEKTPSLEPKVDRNAEELKAVKAQLAAERTARISARLDNVIAKNPALDREEWLPVVLDNAELLEGPLQPSQVKVLLGPMTPEQLLAQATW